MSITMICVLFIWAFVYLFTSVAPMFIVRQGQGAKIYQSEPHQVCIQCVIHTNTLWIIPTILIVVGGEEDG